MRKQTDEDLSSQTSQSALNSLPARLDANSLLSQLEEINALVICNWLVDHPSILDLANRMLSAKSSTSYSEPLSNNSIIMNNATNNVSVIYLFY